MSKTYTASNKFQSLLTTKKLSCECVSSSFFSLDMLVDVNVCIKCEIVVNDWFSTAVADDVDDNDDDVIGGGKVRCYAGVPFIHDINKYFKWLVWHVFIPTETFIARKILCLTYLFFGTFFTFPSRNVFQNQWENFTIFFLHLEFLILEHTLSIHFLSFSELDKLIDRKSRRIFCCICCWHMQYIKTR